MASTLESLIWVKGAYVDQEHGPSFSLSPWSLGSVAGIALSPGPPLPAQTVFSLPVGTGASESSTRPTSSEPLLREGSRAPGCTSRAPLASGAVWQAQWGLCLGVWGLVSSWVGEGDMMTSGRTHLSWTLKGDCGH